MKTSRQIPRLITVLFSCNQDFFSNTSSIVKSNLLQFFCGFLYSIFKSVKNLVIVAHSYSFTNPGSCSQRSEAFFINTIQIFYSTDIKRHIFCCTIINYSTYHVISWCKRYSFHMRIIKKSKVFNMRIRIAKN